MIFWLDNQENTNDVHNENYGRELLELFSMGIGNYTEDDVKECARAFTGWSIRNLLNTGPFGRNVWQFQFNAGPARLRREDVPRRDRQLRRRGRHRHHRAAAGDGAVHRPAALPLLRLGRRGRGGHRRAGPGLRGVRPRHPRGHAGAAPLGRLPLRGGALRQGQEPGRARRRPDAPDWRPPLPDVGPQGRGARVPVHGPGPDEPAERRGLAHRQGVDRHRHPGRAGQLRGRAGRRR